MYVHFYNTVYMHVDKLALQYKILIKLNVFGHRCGDTVLCSWVRHFTLTVPHSTQVCKWVLAKCWGVTWDGLASHPGGVEILLATCYRNRDKLQQLWAPLGFTYSSFYLMRVRTVLN